MSRTLLSGPDQCTAPAAAAGLRVETEDSAARPSPRLPARS